jgi:hypothetical protein
MRHRGSLPCPDTTDCVIAITKLPDTTPPIAKKPETR